MAKFWTVFKREYLERVRTKSFLILSFVGPLFFGAIIVLPAYFSAKSLKNASIGRLEIIDASGIGLGQQVRTVLIAPADPTLAKADSATLTVKVVVPSAVADEEATATTRVMHNDISGYLVVDSATVAGHSARYAGRNASAVGEIAALSEAIHATVLRYRLEHEGLDPAKIAALTNVRVQLSSERISEHGRGGSGVASAILGGVMAFMLYISLILYGQNTLRSVLDEKTTRVAEVIVASVKTDILLAGKVLGVAAVGITQQLIWVVCTALIYVGRSAIFAKLGMPNASISFALPHVSIGMGIAFGLFFLLGFIFYSSLFAAAGATVSSDQEAQQAAQPIMMLIILSILFIQPILIAPSSTMAKVMSWLPFSAPIVMPLRMEVVSLSPVEITLVLLGLVAGCAVSIWMASKIYRVGLLMYGKRPSFRELGRWIAQS